MRDCRKFDRYLDATVVLLNFRDVARLRYEDPFSYDIGRQIFAVLRSILERMASKVSLFPIV